MTLSLKNLLRRVALPLLLAGAAGASHAAICRAAPTVSGSANGTTWADAMTLQAALGNSGCDEIWLKQGLYKPGTQRTDAFAINRPVQLYGGFAGGETARGQRGTSSRLTVLSGDIDNNDTTDANGIVLDADHQTGGGNSYHVVTVRWLQTFSATRSNTVIDGLTITGGRATGSVDDSRGGGLHCNTQGGQCSPTLRNVTFSGNYASSGGAIYNSGNSGDASPLITHATFTGNVAGGSGGAIYNRVSGTGSASPAIEQSTFSSNRAGYRGGAVLNDGAVQLGIAFSTFYGNTAANQGGAISSEGGAQAAITASVFWGNTASGPGKQVFDDGSGAQAFGGNLVQGGCSGVYLPYGTCTGNPLPGDPLLGTLQDNGGPTWTMLPGAGSPALGAATCSAGETDQRGVARPTGACALGAVERQASLPGFPASINTTSNQVRQITLDWPPVAYAAAYVVATVPGGQEVCHTSAAACVVTGLDNGQTYNFTLTALNEVGSGTPIGLSGSTLALPDAPASFTASPAGETEITLAWTAASGATGYRVVNTATSATVCATASTSCSHTGLAAGTAYGYSLVATNAAGDSSPPAATASATTLRRSFTSGGVTASVIGGGALCTFDTAALLAAPAAVPGSVPAFAQGVLDFELAGCTGPVTMTVAYPAPLAAGTKYWKQRGGAWSEYPAAIDLAAGTAVFTLTDGGPGDDGPAGDGRIQDPSGAGLMALAPGNAAAIPTLSQWGALLLTLVLGVFGLQRFSSLRKQLSKIE
ncbi:choice-of-anchor U domain-containing protein [Acidovorax sp. MR-S7]|uniref:choice-of-anchor U domain-containing protein n=1 Tax=Acidovorax sp. MR-S7 TaxID=1268622 RepID=UPI00038053DF|nr:choice-of-anchor U domain-containing protein [Acidovorax sp. MR-S7]GAD20541.1 hypothetical protein AVS7_00302 [Acidovorax sp. MR-S7]